MLRPYCDFYSALWNRHILDDFVPARESDQFRFRLFLSNQRALLLEQHLDSAKIERELTRWKDYLIHFKGKLVYRLDEIDREVYLWDSTRKRFILFSAP
jgi:hypothetical protein